MSLPTEIRRDFFLRFVAKPRRLARTCRGVLSTSLMTSSPGSNGLHISCKRGVGAKRRSERCSTPVRTRRAHMSHRNIFLIASSCRREWERLRLEVLALAKAGALETLADIDSAQEFIQLDLPQFANDFASRTEEE